MVYETNIERGLRYTFRATLIENAPDCYEEVWLVSHGEPQRIHAASFASRNLGSASRDEYVRVMGSSIADRWWRDHK